MKKKIIMFGFIFAVIFAGMILTNLIGCVIYGASDGTVWARMIDLPYVAYVIVSLLMSLFLTFVITGKMK